MTQTHAIHSLVARVADVSVDHALAAALPSADPHDQAALAQLIIRRGHPEGLLALVSHYDALDPATRHWVLAHVADLYRPLREAARLDDPDIVANALAIIRDTREMKLAYLVAERLRHGDARLRGLAAEALRDLARAATSGVARRDAPYLHAAIDEAVRLYRHHEQAAVADALLMVIMRPVPESRRQLDDRHNPIVAVLKERLANAAHAEDRAGLLPLLGTSLLAASALAGLARCGQRGSLADLLEHGHVLLLPRVRQALRGVTEPLALWPAPDVLLSWPHARTRHLAAWAVALPSEVEGQLQQLTTLGKAPDAMARLAALRHLLALWDAHRDRDFGQAVALFCDDASEAVAAAALRGLMRRHWSGLSRILPTLVNGPHPRVSRMAAEHLAPVGFERLWQRWPQLTREQRLSAGRALLKLDPRFHASLGRRLATGDVAGATQALAMIADLRQGTYFEAALLQLTHHRDKRIASAAVRGLGSAGGEAVRAALQAALQDPDARVRANAVEALEELDASPQATPRLHHMARQDANRPRANAIKLLLRMDVAVALEALRTMLADTRPEHRRSALWLVEKMGIVDVARQVADAAVADPDPRLKQRAGRVMRQLTAALGGAAAMLVCTATLWADEPRTWGLSDVARHADSDILFSPWWLAVAGGALLAVIGLLSLRAVRDPRQARPAPMLVFRRVAEAVGLDLGEQWLLVRIAKARKLPTPLTLLLSEGTLVHHAVAWADTLGPRRQRDAMIRIDALRQKLFAPAPTALDTTDARHVA